MRRQIQIKEILLALGIFILPMLIYCHLFFDDSAVTPLQVFDFIFIHRNVSDEYFVYNFLRFFTPLCIYYLLWSKSSLWFKVVLFFPIYMVLWRVMATLTPLNTEVEEIFIQVASILLVVALSFSSKMMREEIRIFSLRKYQIRSKHLIISLLFIALPFVYNIWKLFPEGTSTLNLYFFQFQDFGFVDANTALYTLLQKGCFALPLLVFFLIEKKWWKYALLSPLILYANQIFNIFDSKATVVDELELTQSGPYLVILAIFLVFLSKAVENQHQIKSFIEAIYIKVEVKVARRFEGRQHYIEEQREKLNRSLSELVELEKLKAELEQELQKP